MSRFLKILAFLIPVWWLELSAGAQTITNVIDPFNTNSYPNGTITNKWSNWFGGAFQSLSLDAGSETDVALKIRKLKTVDGRAETADAVPDFKLVGGHRKIRHDF